jgi:basic membrane protein A
VRVGTASCAHARMLTPSAKSGGSAEHWSAYYTEQAQAVIDGKWKPTSVWGGIKDGMVKFENISAAVPADVKLLVTTKEKEIIAGTLTPFAGPVKDNEGKVRLEKGPMSDEALSKMDYYVDGVVGKLPAK